MAYPDDLVGKYIQWNHIGAPLLEREKDSDDYVLTGHSTNLSVPVFNYRTGNRGGSSKSGPIPVPKREATFVQQIPWDISFLDYFPGKVTVGQLSQVPVLTGPMSGCFLFRYEQDGSTWVAHVGTSEREESSTEAKRNWINYVDSLMATKVGGQSPLGFFDDPTLQSAAKLVGGPPQIYGLFEPDGSFYALLFARIKSGALGHGYVKVCALKQSYLQSWDVIKKNDSFKSICK